MSANRSHPQQLPPEIYRRRRVAAVVLLALVVWAAFAIANLFTGGSGAANTNQTPAAITNCDPKNIEVQAIIGDGTSPKSSFAAGENPQIWWSVTNLGAAACNFNVGAKVQFFTITSGKQVIWASKDCDRSQDTNVNLTLQPGEVQQSPASAWLRVYSSSTGCGAEQNPVPAGGASYHLVVEVNGVKSSNDVQFLLN